MSNFGSWALKGYIKDCQKPSLWILWLTSENSKTTCSCVYWCVKLVYQTRIGTQKHRQSVNHKQWPPTIVIHVQVLVGATWVQFWWMKCNLHGGQINWVMPCSHLPAVVYSSPHILVITHMIKTLIYRTIQDRIIKWYVGGCVATGPLRQEHLALGYLHVLWSCGPCDWHATRPNRYRPKMGSSRTIPCLPYVLWQSPLQPGGSTVLPV